MKVEKENLSKREALVRPEANIITLETKNSPVPFSKLEPADRVAAARHQRRMRIRGARRVA